MIKSGNSEDRAVHFCWLMHLVGDIHQPLHCTALFSEQFPSGDRGGNLAIVRIGRGRKNLHSFWNGILGDKITLADIGSTAEKIHQLVEADPTVIGDDVANHTKPMEWAEAGRDAARKVAYLDYGLKVESDTAAADIPSVPDNYAAGAGKTARLCIAKASERLAKLVVEVIE